MTDNNQQIGIMVVEDESLVSLDISARLRHLGYVVPCTVSTGKDAVLKAGELKPALVLMDIGLKGDMDGIEAAIQIRARFNIPVIFLTAYGDNKTFESARAAEPYGYIYKPFDDADLRACVEAALLKVSLENLSMN